MEDAVAESLELVQFDPTVENSKTWEAGDINNIEKYFAQTIYHNTIMEDFPKPNYTSVLDDEVKKLIQHVSRISVVLKKSVSHRPVINLMMFKMESLSNAG